MSRLENSIRNLTFGTLGHFFGYLLNFITRKIFIVFLSIEYLGLNGLFSNILSLLSFAELGIGTAICYSLYRPLAFNETDRVRALMTLFKKAYRVIGTFIIVVGISLTPFLSSLIGDIPEIQHINLIYVMFVVNSGASYYLSYKRTLLVADQKKYIDSTYYYGFQFIKYAAQILVLVLTQEYILFLSVMLVMTLTENISISIKVNSLYPYIKERTSYKLSSDEKKQIKKNVFALMFHKLGSVIVNGTDNILIVRFVSLSSAGIYANYLMVTSALNHMIGVVYSSVSASIGNLVAESEGAKQLEVFHQLDFLTAWIMGFSSISLFICFNPFISLWLGPQFTFSLPVVLVISVNFYLFGMLRSVRTFYSSMGLFWYDRYKPIFESFINLGASIFLANRIGLIGILLGTTISTVLTCFWFEPFVLFRYGMKLPLWNYFLTYSKYTLITVLSGVATYFLIGFFSLENRILSLIVAIGFCALVPNLIFLLFYAHKPEFAAVLLMIKKIMSKIKRKRR